MQVFPIAIGEYLNHPDLPVDAEVERVGELLAEFGGYLSRWTVPAHERGRDAVDDRLHEWTEPNEPPHDTVLYWVGHGESTGEKAALAHRRSPASYAENGVPPEALASAILRRQGALADNEPWALVIVDACQSARFVQLLAADLYRDLQGVRRILVVGTSGAGRAWLGRFSSALETCLRHTFRANPTIALADLARQLERMLPECELLAKRVGDAALVRRVAVAATMSVPLDVLAEVEAVLADMTEDERRHFVPKAQGAETGEVTWYFEGRARERWTIVNWLRTHRSGMLIVTGAAGSGKSALLGHVLVHSRPELRELLVHHGLVDPLPESELPPDDVFDATIHLTGMSTADVVTVIAGAAGYLVASRRGEEMPLLLRALDGALFARNRSLTLLIDALDEAQDPLAVASVLSRLARGHEVRLVIGTRRSTMEGPDLPEPADDDLLRALRVREQDEVLVVSRDPEAVARFVRRRLAKGAPNVPADQVELAANVIAQQGQEFLFARLAVYELIARPERQDYAGFEWLVQYGHLGLFNAAVSRLERRRPGHSALLKALALARGRGLPIKDGIWSRVASVFADTDSPLDDEDIVALLANAAPYVMLDAEDGQSVYRLAHRTFQDEFFPNHEDHYRVVGVLLAAAAAHDGPLNPYIVRHLTGHIGAAEPAVWGWLAEQPSVLDRLDPRAIAADALRTGFGRMPLPAEIAGVLAAHHLLRDAAPENRRGLREIAMARHANVQYFPEPSGAWSVRLALLRQHPMHLTMTGHTGAVHAVVTFRTRDGRQLLATGGADATVRIWDPTIGTQLGDPLPASAPVTNLVAITGESGQVLLAGACPPGTIRLWDPDSGDTLRDLLADNFVVTAMTAVRHRDGRWLLVIGSADGVIRIWDPLTGEAVGQPLTGNGRAVTTLTTFVDPTDRSMLAGAVKDGTVFVWDPETGTRVHTIDGGRRGRVTGLAAVTDPNGHILLATSRWHNTIRVNELHERWGPLRFTAPTKPLTSVIVFPTGDGWTIAAGSTDGLVWLWDARHPSQRRRLTGGKTMVNAMTILPHPDGNWLLATGSEDGAVRVWAPDSADDDSDDPAPFPVFPTGIVPFTEQDGWTSLIIGGIGTSAVLEWTTNPDNYELPDLSLGQMSAMVTFLNDHNRRRLLYLDDGTAWIRDPDMESPPMQVARVGKGATHMAVFRGREGRLRLATAGGDRLVHTWDLDTGKRADFPHSGHQGRTTAITSLSDDNRTLLATGGEDSAVRVWDPHTGAQVWSLELDTDKPIHTLVAIPGTKTRLAVTTREGTTLRVWDPHTDSTATFTGHTSWITVVTTMTRGDKTLLVSGDDIGTVNIWDPDDAVIRTIRTGIPVRGLAALHDDVAMVSEEGFLLLSV